LCSKNLKAELAIAFGSSNLSDELKLELAAALTEEMNVGDQQNSTYIELVYKYQQLKERVDVCLSFAL
jgi:hypothetical protein